MASELLDAKTKKSKSKEILNQIYIYEKSLHILEIYGFKKSKLIPCIIWTSSKKSYNLNHVIMIIFNYTHAYARDYTLAYIYIYIYI